MSDDDLVHTVDLLQHCSSRQPSRFRFRLVCVTTRTDEKLVLWLSRLQWLFSRRHKHVITIDGTREPFPDEDLFPSDTCLIVGFVEGRPLTVRMQQVVLRCDDDLDCHQNEWYYQNWCHSLLLPAFFRWHRVVRQLTVQRHLEPYLPQDVCGLVVRWIEV